MNVHKKKKEDRERVDISALHRKAKAVYFA
jgi:hypothetical protein